MACPEGDTAGPVEVPKAAPDASGPTSAADADATSPVAATEKKDEPGATQPEPSGTPPGDESTKSKRPPPKKGEPDAEARAEAWAAALKPTCARELVQMEGIEDDYGPALWFAWAFEGTDPEHSDCTFDTKATVQSREGEAKTDLTCVDGVDGGDLGGDGWWEAVVIEVECAGGGMGGVWPQVWGDRPGGPIPLKVTWPKGVDTAVIDTRWEEDDAGRSQLIFTTNREADSMDPPEELNVDWELKLEGPGLVAIKYVEPAD